MIEIFKKLESMHSNIRSKIIQLEPICDSTDIDPATDAIFNVVLDWIENNTEEIKFK
jgi:hypothetical protein